MPIPTLMEGAQAASRQLRDRRPALSAAGQSRPRPDHRGRRGFVPQLARSWSRRDSVTLVFELDPRARWHDGAPVTARDVLFTFERARDPGIAPRLADAAPAHRGGRGRGRSQRGVPLHPAVRRAALRRDLPRGAAARPSAGPLPPDEAGRVALRVAHPVGNGPYRWVRRVPGQFIELAANDQFFLGPPGIQRVIVRVAPRTPTRGSTCSSAARPTRWTTCHPHLQSRRVAADPDVRLVTVPAHRRVSPVQPARPGDAPGPIRSWRTSTCAERWSWRSTARSWCGRCSVSTERCRSGRPRRSYGSATARASRSGRTARRQAAARGARMGRP